MFVSYLLDSSIRLNQIDKVSLGEPMGCQMAIEEINDDRTSIQSRCPYQQSILKVISIYEHGGGCMAKILYGYFQSTWFEQSTSISNPNWKTDY